MQNNWSESANGGRITEVKTFENCKAKPDNFRTLPHKDFISRQHVVKGEVYRLCNIKLPNEYDLLENQLGEGTYFFIPDGLGNCYGAVVIRKSSGNYILAYEHSFYVGLAEGLFKLKSPRDCKDRELILSMIKGTNDLQKPTPLNWE